MKILFVAPYVPSVIRVRSYHFVRELARNHEVVVLATDGPRAAADAAHLRHICQTVEVVPLRLANSLRSCARAAFLDGSPLQAAVSHSPELDHQLRHVLARRSFDVVHVEHLRAGRLGGLVPDELATVFDAVDSISLLLERTIRFSHSLRQRIIAALELARTRAYEGQLLARFDHTIVTAPDDQRALLSLRPGAQVTVVRNGVDLDAFCPVDGERDPATLVLSGKMSYHANVTAALYFVSRIFPIIRKARPDARLVIAGSNPPPSIRALTSDPAITVTGHVPELREYIGRATVALCPVTVSVGIQNKLLQAMALGVPVVATRAGADGLCATPGRDLLVADTSAQFAEHVCRLFGDRHLAATIGQAGRKYVETHHRWDLAAAQLEGLYTRAMNSKRPTAVLTASDT